MIETALFGLLHVLVFVYWLGGDLGAFYASRFLTAPNVSADRRMMAAKIVGDVDMAPRTALILALPTGLALGISRGWLDLPMVWGWGALAAGAAWLALAWYLHIKHVGSGPLKALDTLIRWALLIVLLGGGVAGLVGAHELPAFISIKLILLAGAILMGLMIRIVLRPLGPALAGLSGPDGASAELSLAQTLSRARPLVMVIWALIIAAAFFGLWTPVTL